MKRGFYLFLFFALKILVQFENRNDEAQTNIAKPFNVKASYLTLLSELHLYLKYEDFISAYLPR